MARLTRIYTRKGDDGSTRLGSGAKVDKDDLQVEAYGTVDELNAAIGTARAAGLDEATDRVLARIQSELLNLGGLLSMLAPEPADATPPGLIESRHVEALERDCDAFNADLGPLDEFVLPAGTPGASLLHLARTIARRAERRIVSLARRQPVPADCVRYVNRLSDLLFILARHENHVHGGGDVLWDRDA